MNRTLLAFGSVTLAMVGGMLAGTTAVNAAWARGDHPYAGLDTLARAMTTIEAHFVEEIGPQQLSRAAVRGMTHALDPHSLYLDPDELRALQDRTEGRFHGIGVEIRLHPQGARIARVLPGGPADLGGMQAGDLVVAIDGESLADWSLDAIADKLRGERGTALRLGLLRDGAELELELVRDQVISPTATGELVAPGQAYVRLEHFRQRTAAELAQELDRLVDEGGQPLEGIVLDLRDNPGGLLEEAVAVVDLFVGQGLVVETRTRGDQPEESLYSHDDQDDLDARLVVLIDGGSASASEIVAGALQDLGRATLVGSPSYGKGSVQQIYEFEDGSALKLTVARYYLPSGRSFDRGKGLVPDVQVDRPTAGAASLNQLRTVLDSALQDGAGLTEEQQAAVDAELARLDQSLAEGPPVEIPRQGSLQQRLAVDPQLSAAWDRLSAGD